MQSDDKAASGIRRRHSRTCSRPAEPCTCKPRYQASVWSHRDGKKIRKTFPTLAAAKGWQRDAMVAVARGEMRSPTRVTVRQAGEAWIAGITTGAIRTRSGTEFKPSTARSYALALRVHVLPELGGLRLSELRRGDVQGLVERLNAKGLDGSTVRNAINPLRRVCHRALVRQEISLNPTAGLELPAVRGRRAPKVSAPEVARLIAAVPERDRALWATAFFAGPRAGELRALRWEDIDLDAGVIRIERTWDRVVGPVAPKSRAGRRAIPIAGELRRLLVGHRLRSGRSSGLVFGRDADVPFDPTSLSERCDRAWRAAGLPRVTLHEARHIAASLMIDAGIALTSVSKFMGHSSIAITADVYGHLVQGAEERASQQLDQYLALEGA